MTKFILVPIELLCRARHLQNLMELRFRTYSGHVQLVTGQGDSDAERLLERRVVHGRQWHDLVVLTSGVQIGHGPAEHGRWTTAGRRARVQR